MSEQGNHCAGLQLWISEGVCFVKSSLPALFLQSGSQVFHTVQEAAQTEGASFGEVKMMCTQVMLRVKAVKRNNMVSIPLSPVEDLQEQRNIWIQHF